MASNVTGGHKINAIIQGAKRAKGVGIIDIGFFSTAKYPDGQHVAQVAVSNEFGVDGIPERPFMRRAIPEIRSKVNRLAKERIDSKRMVIDRNLAGLIGEIGKGEVQVSITTLRDPPNAPSTIARKGSSNPLIDIGKMRRSVTYRID